MKWIDWYFTPIEKWRDNDLNMSGAPQEKWEMIKDVKCYKDEKSMLKGLPIFNRTFR